MRTYFVTFIVSCLLGASVRPDTAQGFFRRYHGANCSPISSPISTFYNDTFGLRNNTPNGNTFVCPIVSDDGLRYPVAFAFVHGNKMVANGTTDRVSVCTKAWFANSNACSFDSTTSNAGPWGLAPPYDVWFNDSGGANLPYIKVFLQSNSSIYGVFTGTAP
jgi:hypothetical protein